MNDGEVCMSRCLMLIMKNDHVDWLRVTTTRVLNGKFYVGVGKGTKDGQTHEMFREIWGVNPSTGTPHRWLYDQSGAVLEGKCTDTVKIV